MKIGYFPGCSLYGSAKEYDLSLRTILQFFDVDLVEIEDWSCCGASSAHSVSHLLSVSLPARNLALAQRQGLKEILVPCAACYNRLVTAQYEINTRPELKKEVEDAIGDKLNDNAEIINIIQLFQKIGAEKITSQKKVDLQGLKAACYYGCLLLRPNSITNFDDAEEPSSMEKIVSQTGAQVVDWNFKTECCGAAHTLTNTNIVTSLSKKIIDDAREHNADVIITACPMCHSNLDMRQIAIKKEYPSHEYFPVFYITEIIGLSIGLDGKTLGTNLHFIDSSEAIVKALGSVKVL